jgi:hypothetical protein
MCSNFNNQMDNTTNKYFYYNLQGAKSHLEESGYWEQYDSDNVDLLLINTHGGVDSNTSCLAMWDLWTNACFNAMKLGDDGRRAKIFSQYACKTLYYGDNRGGFRTGPVFKGGLMYMTGSHDTLKNGYWATDSLEDYASYLQDGDKIKYAWRDGVYDTYYYNDIAVAAPGLDSGYLRDGEFRRDTMTWYNFDTDFPRITGNNVTYVAFDSWTDY